MDAKGIAAALAAAAALILSAKAAQVDYYLKIPGVDGESRAGAHDKWIEITSVSFALDREAGAVRFGDGVSGRRPPAARNGDVDQPVIIGSLPNPQTARQNQTDFAFVMERASRATPKLMQSCADGKHIDRAEIDELRDGVVAVSRVYYDLRFVAFEADGERIEPGAAGRRVARTLKNRPLKADPKVVMRYACMEWKDARTGKKSAPCPTG